MEEDKPITRKKLIGLNAADYEHPLDRTALEKLESIPGARTIVTKIWEKYLDKLVFFENTGSNIEVNKENYAYVYDLLLEACSILDVKDIPPLYLVSSPEMNAYATGVSRPVICINYATIERLDKDELLCVLAHELGHINSGHVLYYYLALQLKPILEIASQLSLGIGGLAGGGIKVALMYWRRMSEFTADRAGLLVCQDPLVCIRSLIKISGLPLENVDIKRFEKSFIKQAKDFEDFDYGTMNKLIRFQSTIDNTHPWSVLRASELLKWEESDEYKNILNGENIKDEKKNIFCRNCGSKLIFSDKFCGNCGSSINH